MVLAPGIGVPTERCERVCYRNWSCCFTCYGEGGFLAKRPSNSAGEPTEVKAKRGGKAVLREYVPIEDDPTAAESAPEDASNGNATESAKPSMQEVFGPGGFLEKCMRGGFDPATVSSDYEHR